MSGLNTTSDIELLEILKNQNIKINGVFMKDELPKKLTKGFYIVNLQSSTEGNGTHWVALYYSPFYSYYFDAFGFIAPLEIQNKIFPYAYNDRQIQNLKSSACGFYCIAFIMFLFGKKDMENLYRIFINLFSNDTKRNDEVLERLLYK